MKKAIIGIVAVVIVIALFLTTCTGFVSTGFTGVLTTFGKVEDKTLEAGFHIKSPFQQIVQMDNREQRKEFKTQSFSSDIQQVDIVGSINFNINKTTAMNLFKEVGTEYYSTLIMPRLMENVKTVFSKYTAESLIASRELLSSQIKALMQSEMDEYGINIISVSIEDIDFAEAFTDAVEAKQVAEQTKLKVATEEQTKTLQAQQEAERQRIAADAEAYGITAAAEAEAEANKKIAESLTSELIEYQYARGWDGKYPSTLVVGESSELLPVLTIGTGADNGGNE